MPNNKEKFDEIVMLLKKAQAIASQLGFINLFQPGLVKEIITANILNHEVHTTKHEADAWDPLNPNVKYEYLSCWEGGTFQLDRMFKHPEDKKRKSLQRIIRNDCFFCVVFKKEAPLDIKTIYKITTEYILQETERQLAASSNDISHVGFTIRWAEENGQIVYQE
jgi:hypothetical protein